MLENNNGKFIFDTKNKNNTVIVNTETVKKLTDKYMSIKNEIGNYPMSHHTDELLMLWFTKDLLAILYTINMDNIRHYDSEYWNIIVKYNDDLTLFIVNLLSCRLNVNTCPQYVSVNSETKNRKYDYVVLRNYLRNNSMLLLRHMRSALLKVNGLIYNLSNEDRVTYFKNFVKNYQSLQNIYRVDYIDGKYVLFVKNKLDLPEESVLSYTCSPLMVDDTDNNMVTVNNGSNKLNVLYKVYNSENNDSSKEIFKHISKLYKDDSSDEDELIHDYVESLNDDSKTVNSILSKLLNTYVEIKPSIFSNNNFTYFLYNNETATVLVILNYTENITGADFSILTKILGVKYLIKNISDCTILNGRININNSVIIRDCEIINTTINKTNINAITTIEASLLTKSTLLNLNGLDLISFTNIQDSIIKGTLSNLVKINWEARDNYYCKSIFLYSIFDNGYGSIRLCDLCLFTKCYIDEFSDEVSNSVFTDCIFDNSIDIQLLDCLINNAKFKRNVPIVTGDYVRVDGKYYSLYGYAHDLQNVLSGLYLNIQQELEDDDLF